MDNNRQMVVNLKFLKCFYLKPLIHNCQALIICMKHSWIQVNGSNEVLGIENGPVPAWHIVLSRNV